MGLLLETPLPHRTWYRLLFLAAALDGLAAGLWTVLKPEGLFQFLEAPPTPDGLRMWQVLGWVALMNAVLAGCLLQPERWGGLVVALLLGRALDVGLWLFAWGTERVHLPASRVLLLAAHDAIWLPGYVAFGLAWRRWLRKP